MKRYGKVMLLAMAVLAFGVLPASAQQPSYAVDVMGDNDLPVTTATCRVNNSGLNTLATIYTSNTLATAAANPLAVDTTTGRCRFFMDNASTTAVNVIISVASGPYKGAHTSTSVTRTGQKMVRLNRSSPVKKLVVPFAATASAATTTSSQTLPAGARVISAVLETTTAPADATATFNVNVATGAGSICANVPSGVVGFQDCQINGPMTAALPTAGAVTYHNQNHAPAGFVHIFYFEPTLGS